ncbi:MAG: alpha/beta hydrolase [Micavibrio aeruginosavorus]|uniref:Alpha/beta hydrolase n=1 Tax=Micavibrio aeruginosavorus TaxID=349221 RepID=A0A7T5UG77_9BACT|nr:MAG: alpha/beta hydrolase [Micavibrio aeruginosavorus]
MRTRALILSQFLLFFLLLVDSGQAMAAGERLRERMAERMGGRAGENGWARSKESGDHEFSGIINAKPSTCAEQSRKVEAMKKRGRAARLTAGPTPDIADVKYGGDPLQALDVFRPVDVAGGGLAPVIVMVHGGGWCVGDKSMKGVTANKVSRWTAKGFLFVSVNYPMVMDALDALDQADEIARATAYIQQHAHEWGGDGRRVILMGHSAGAHLVSLVNADAGIRQRAGVAPLLGTVSLDSGAIDVPRQMPDVVPALTIRYREAFGTDESVWIKASPHHQLGKTAAPWLGVCSTTRPDDPCGQAQSYAEKSRALGIPADVLALPKNHGALNSELGQPGSYTEKVEAFMASLDPVVAGLLGL